MRIREENRPKGKEEAKEEEVKAVKERRRAKEATEKGKRKGSARKVN